VILDRIIESTRMRVTHLESEVSLAEVEAAARRREPARDFADALNGAGISLIAEVKRASPSRGLLRRDLDASSLAREYSAGGAAAISVLTEKDHFLGSFADLEAARAATGLPVLCKDFVIEEYQVYEARARGADAVLLIAAVLSRQRLQALLATARSLGMAALVEVHNRAELAEALECRPRVIGVNNRDLADFSVDLKTTLDLRPLIPSGVLVVSESGIHTRDDVLTLEEAGVNAILVGEALVTSPSPAAKIAELLGRVEGGGR